jgi:hypothetical protein
LEDKPNRIIMKTLFVFTLLSSVILTACHTESQPEKVAISEIQLAPPVEEKAMNFSVPLAPAVGSSGNTEERSKDLGKKIVKEGQVNFECRNISKTRTALYNSLAKLGGYIAVERQNDEGDSTRKVYFMQVRVPADNFERFLSSVPETAERIDSKNIHMRDATSEYIDLNAQLINKKALEARYLELLKKGTKIKDLLEIENKVAEIRTDIESTQGNLNYLSMQVAYSALDITFYVDPPVKSNVRTFAYRIANALSDGTNALGSFFIGLLAMWPLWILSIPGYFAVKNWKRKTAAKLATQEAA